MKLILLVPSTIFLLTFYCDCQQINEWPDGMTMRPGDRIRCLTGWSKPLLRVFTYHILLAIDSETMIHVIGSGSKARVVEDTISEYLARNMEDECLNDGPGKKGRSRAVQSAKASLNYWDGEETYYNKFTCNCQHWVAKWADGEAWSYSAKTYASSNCFKPIIEVDYQPTLLESIFSGASSSSSS